MVKINFSFKQVFNDIIRDVEFSKSMMFKRILPILLGTSLLIAGISTLVYKKFFKKNLKPSIATINTPKLSGEKESTQKPKIIKPISLDGSSEHPIPGSEDEYQPKENKGKVDEKSSGIINLSRTEDDVEDTDDFQLLVCEYTKFIKFAEEENIHFKELDYPIERDGNFYIESANAVIAYGKYLIKNSINNPLKNVAASDIIFVCDVTQDDNMKRVMNTIRDSTRRIPWLIYSCISKDINKERSEDVSSPNKADYNPNSEVNFLDINVLQTHIRKDAIRELGTEDIIVCKLNSDESYKGFNSLKDKDPNIKIKIYGTFNSGERIAAMNKSLYLESISFKGM